MGNSLNSCLFQFSSAGDWRSLIAMKRGRRGGIMYKCTVPAEREILLMFLMRHKCSSWVAFYNSDLFWKAGAWAQQKNSIPFLTVICLCVYIYQYIYLCCGYFSLSLSLYLRICRYNYMYVCISIYVHTQYMFIIHKHFLYIKCKLEYQFFEGLSV